MAELSQFLRVFDHEQGALHQDIAVFDGTTALVRLLPAGGNQTSTGPLNGRNRRCPPVHGLIHPGFGRGSRSGRA